MRFESPSISFQGLTKVFKNQKVLSELNFDIPKNAIVTILGFSGAGKSTLLKHILGILSPTKGRVEILGKDLAVLDMMELREFRRNFGMLFQYAALFDSLTTFENVSFPLKEFTDMGKYEMDEKVRELLESVGIKEVSYGKLPSELSGGMRKRVGLARALALQPKIMLYDEPTTGLDPITTKTVNNLIVETHKRKRKGSMTSVIISHDVKASLEVSDFVAFLDRGKIVEYLSVDDFKKSENDLVQQFINL